MVGDFIRVDAALNDVQDRISGSDAIELLADAAYRRGEQMALGPSPAVAQAVEFTLGTPVLGTNTVTYPIRWKALGATAFFPMMDAELVLSSLGGSTHIEFRGVYTPPLGGLGALLDRIAFHHIAEATVRGFLERLVASLELRVAV